MNIWVNENKKKLNILDATNRVSINVGNSKFYNRIANLLSNTKVKKAL